MFVSLIPVALAVLQKLKDVRMPKDGDDGFFLFTGKELESSVFVLLYSSRWFIYISFLFFNTETRNHKLEPEISCSCSGPSNSALDKIVLRLLCTGIAQIYIFSPLFFLVVAYLKY